jgi:lipoprotein-releasing system permease protein
VRLELSIAMTHLLHRKRQTLVSLTGIVLGVAFFLGVSSLMRGSELDFIKRLVDNSPHITVSDEYRSAREQPASAAWPDGAVQLHGVKPQTEVRGIRGYQRALAFIESMPGLRAAPVLTGSVVLTFAGQVHGTTLSGMVPEKMKTVSTLEDKLIAGTMDALDANLNGIIIGEGLADRFSLSMGDNVNVTSADGNVRTMKIVGIFRTGNASYDENQVFVRLKRAQVLLNRPNRVNRLLVQLDDPYAARDVATVIESRIGYKAQSWIEASEDLLSVLTVRNIIMYSVVAAILVVASFGIYNTISTIVMEKIRDIAIMKSMGFHARDIRRVFVIEGVIVGVIGSILGFGLGLVLMGVLGQVAIKPPGASEVIYLPVYRGLEQFVLAAAFALASSVGAAWLPARKGGRVHPVDILRGAA